MALVMTPVTSTAIKAIGYDGGSKTLFIEFNKNKAYPTYQFGPVSAHTAGRMFKAVSIGTYYHRYIKARADSGEYYLTPSKRTIADLERDIQDNGGSVVDALLGAVEGGISGGVSGAVEGAFRGYSGIKE